jgi:hypothetical protein
MPLRAVIIPPNEQCSAAIIIYPYQTQEVRDLAWSCFHPPLIHAEQVPGAISDITSCTLELTPSRRLWLEQLDRDATALHDYLSHRPSHRLGVYFEQLWHFFLQQDPETELIAHNLAVHHQGKTLGEFDCIYYCHQRARHIHLELAVKYFLAAPRGSDTDGVSRVWVGPDNRDRLDLKLDHLLGRQILLGDNPIATQRLHDLGVENPIKEVSFKGYLFKPWAADTPPPPGYNNACHLNEWLTPDQFESHIAALTSDAFIILPKMRWLCTATSLHCREVLSTKELPVWVNTYLKSNSYPLLIAALDNNTIESSRFFVVPENWPDHGP